MENQKTNRFVHWIGLWSNFQFEYIYDGHSSLSTELRHNTNDIVKYKDSYWVPVIHPFNYTTDYRRLSLTHIHTHFQTTRYKFQTICLLHCISNHSILNVFSVASNCQFVRYFLNVSCLDCVYFFHKLCTC